MRRQAGMSLAEVLISLVLSSLIVTILVQFYLSTKRQYLEAEELLATNLDLRWAGDLLADSIRRAGFTPCLAIDKLNLYQQGRKIYGLTHENSPKQRVQVNRMDEHFAKVVNINRATPIPRPPYVCPPPQYYDWLKTELRG